MSATRPASSFASIALCRAGTESGRRSDLDEKLCRARLKILAKLEYKETYDHWIPLPVVLYSLAVWVVETGTLDSFVGLFKRTSFALADSIFFLGVHGAE
jgi:hypothetical protein